MDNNEFKQFIKDSLGQKEVSLAIASNGEEKEAFCNLLLEDGYVLLDNIFTDFSQVEEHPKVCLVINNQNAKSIYDFSLQYPTGQINLMDYQTMKNYHLNPQFVNHSIVLLAMTEQLSHLSKQNLDFMGLVGMVHREK